MAPGIHSVQGGRAGNTHQEGGDPFGVRVSNLMELPTKSVAAMRTANSMQGIARKGAGSTHWLCCSIRNVPYFWDAEQLRGGGIFATKGKSAWSALTTPLT